MIIQDNFSYFEVLLMSTQNICFYRELEKNYPIIITKYSFLAIPLGKFKLLYTRIQFDKGHHFTSIQEYPGFFQANGQP